MRNLQQPPVPEIRGEEETSHGRRLTPEEIETEDIVWRLGSG
jgi:hypothetical protein